MNARTLWAIAGVVALLAMGTGASAMSVKDYASSVSDRAGPRVQRIVTNTDAYRHAAAGRVEVARCIARTFTAPPDGAAAPSSAMAALLADLDKDKDRSDRSVEAAVLHAVVTNCPSAKPPVVPGPADLASDWTPVASFQRAYTEVEKRYAVSLASSTQAVRLLVEGRKKAARCIAKRFVVHAGHAGHADPKGLTKLLSSMDPGAPVERNIVEALAAACGRSIAEATAPR